MLQEDLATQEQLSSHLEQELAHRRTTVEKMLVGPPPPISPPLPVSSSSSSLCDGFAPHGCFLGVVSTPSELTAARPRQDHQPPATPPGLRDNTKSKAIPWLSVTMSGF